MAKANADWKVLAHGPLTELADNLWWVQGSLPGMTLKRNMTVVRLDDGRLVIHNAIALEESVMRQLERLGDPAHLLVPSAYHRLDAPAYKQRYPALRVFAPEGARKKVEELVPVDGNYDDYPASDRVWLSSLRGTNDSEGVMLVRSGDGVTAVCNDVVMNMDRKRDLLGFLFTSVLGSAPGPRISRLSKLMLVKDRKILRDELERIAVMPELVRLVVAHEKVASGAAAGEALRAALGYL